LRIGLEAQAERVLTCRRLPETESAASATPAIPIRLSRRFYSPILLFEAYAANLRLCVPRRDLGPPPSAMRPCARGRWRGDARTGTDGGVRRPRLHAPIRAFLAFDLPRSRCLLAVAVFLTPFPGRPRLDRCRRRAGSASRTTGSGPPRAPGDATGVPSGQGTSRSRPAKPRTCPRRAQPLTARRGPRRQPP